MVERTDNMPADDDGLCDPSDDDEQVGAAVEAYLALAEQGPAPAIDEFAARYPELKDDVRSALEGLELVHGLLGLDSGQGSGLGRGSGLDHRIESGRRIAGYRVVRELGRGGMGTVYEAVHVGLDRPVALKVLGIHAAPDSSARRRFLNEARTAAGLHHTHIVPVFDVGQVGGLCYYAMQRIEGSGLDRVVRHLRQSRPPVPGGGGGPASGRFGASDAQGASSINSRLRQLWIRVSSGWLKRQNRQNGVAQGIAKAAAITPLLAPSQPAIANGKHAQAAVGDSTASWSHGSGQIRLDGARVSTDLARSGIISASQVSLSATEPAARRRDDEPVPFDPPRGSAYFRWVAELGLQSADALAHAHHQGVIHRDVKPSNLLVDGRGNLWVTDFGLARRLADPGLTHHDSLLGTPRYMSPEQARTGSIDGRTDVYSLGATLYELLTLQPPFDGRSAAELIEQIGQQEPAPPSAIDQRVPRDLETIVLKALAKRPADRYMTAAELAEDLARFLNHEPVKARRISPVGRLWRVARRHPGITSVTTAATVLILAIATFAYVRVVAERDRYETERDRAVDAGGKLQEAMQKIKLADRQKLADMKKDYLQTAVIVGQTTNPDRRRVGLEFIRKAVALEPEPELRPQLRDEAVKFLVLPDVETRPELASSRASSLVFGRAGHRLGIISEDNEELAFWNVVNNRRLATFSLRGAPTSVSGPPESAVTESLGSDRAEPGPGAGPQMSVDSTRGRTGSPAGTGTGGASPAARHFRGPRVALAGNYVAALFPDESGVRLIDPLSGAPYRTLPRRGSSVLGVLSDPGGQRLLTIETVSEDAMSAALEGLADWDPAGFPGKYQVNLWDPDHLDAPIHALDWLEGPREQRGGLSPRASAGSGSGPSPDSAWPLVAISPDAKTVAVAPRNGMFVRLFSAEDGKPKRARPFPPQPPLSALALGPNSMLATAGRGSVQIYDLDNPAFPTSLTPNQNVTWQMRFSPHGSLLALAGLGQIELWDPVAHNLVNQLPNSEQASDMAFSPDGHTLAAVGRAGGTLVWNVIDSAMRTQLSGFDTRPSSLAFGADGILAVGSWDGSVWFWRNGRCPEIGTPSPQSLSAKNHTEPVGGRSLPPGRDAGNRRGGPLDRGRPPFVPQDRDRPVAVAFDVDGRLLAHNAQGLRIWQVGPSSAQVSPIFNPPLDPAAGPFNMTPLAKTPDGTVMVLVRSSAIFLWHAEKPDRLISVVPPPHSGVETATGAPSGSRRSVTTGTDAPARRFRAVQLGPGGDRIYLIDQSGMLHAWAIDGQTETSEAQVQAHELNWAVPLTDGASSLAVRRDGTVLAVGDRAGTVTLVETDHPRVLARIKPSSGEVESLVLALAFSPDGHGLAVGGSQEGTISIWSVVQPTQPRLGLRLPGHKGLVTNLVFDPQGQRLASATGIDPLVEVWNLELIQQELARLGLFD
jgi:eukaryotic-like serine/threonine-protein kinase